MTLTYRTEYRLVGRVDRTYRGVHALAAIAADLLLASIFGLIRLAFAAAGWVVRLAWRAVRLVARCSRAVVAGLARGIAAAIRPPSRMTKPAWAGSVEL